MRDERVALLARVRGAAGGCARRPLNNTRPKRGGSRAAGQAAAGQLPAPRAPPPPAAGYSDGGKMENWAGKGSRSLLGLDGWIDGGEGGQRLLSPAAAALPQAEHAAAGQPPANTPKGASGCGRRAKRCKQRAALHAVRWLLPWAVHADVRQSSRATVQVAWPSSHWAAS